MVLKKFSQLDLGNDELKYISVSPSYLPPSLLTSDVDGTLTPNHVLAPLNIRLVVLTWMKTIMQFLQSELYPTSVTNESSTFQRYVFFFFFLR